MISRDWKKKVAATATCTALCLHGQLASAGDFLRDLFSSRSDCVQLTATQEILFATRDARTETDGIVSGPDAGRLHFDNSDFDPPTGYRIGLGFQTPEHKVEALYADYGTWFSQNTGSLSAGLSFDGAIPGSWAAGSNTLGANTFFTPMFAAATADAEEAEGLGPNLGFADTLPTYQQYYQSQMQDLQVNWLNNDAAADIRLGIGYRNVQLEETAGLQITGAFRATDLGGGANGGLSDGAITGAGLTFTTNVANGFDDESPLGNNGAPDQLTLAYTAQTSNQLNGFQAIVDACLIDGQRFELTLVGKAGAFHNHASGSVQERYRGIGNDVSAYGRSFRDTKDTVAFVGGVAAKGRFRISRQTSLFAGYEGTFVSGVALSPEQANGIRGTIYEVDTDGNIIVHGANLGVEFIY